MKNILILSILAASASAHAGLFGAAATSDWQTKQTKKYKLDVYGYDARAYEFNTDNGMKCVMVFPGGDAKGWQMQCVPAAQQEQPKK